MMEPHEIYDLQTAGIKLVKQRQKIRRLEKENTDLRIQIDSLKLTIEEILLTPDGHMKKDRPG